MTKTEIVINRIAQNKIEFDQGCEMLLNDEGFDFKTVFSILKNYIFNSIPDKSNYNSDVYRNAIKSIPLRPTFTPNVILSTFPTKVAFNKLEKLPRDENSKIITALLWIFKQTDSERRNTVCANGCVHEWHNID